jgi:predicted site-specific integrase-resolvase
MTIEEGIYSYIQTKSGVTSLVSTRVYPSNMPQDFTLPAIVYFRVSSERQHEARESSVTQGKARARYQFDCMAETYDGAKALGEALRIAMDGYIGLMGSNTVQACSLENDRDIYDSELDIYMRVMDFRIVYLEATS